MKRSKNKKSNPDRPSQARTEVHCSHDLERTLKELTSACSNGDIERLEDLLTSLAREFHPASVTMTTTNIPDAILKLSSVVEETAEAAQRVFSLVDRQKVLLEKSEEHAANLAALLTHSPVDIRAVQLELSKSTGALNELRALTHQIVEAQEFQDLCGQKVDKVIKLLSSLDDRLRLVLTHLRYPLSPPSSSTGEQDDPDLDQGDADEILKRFGI